MSKRRESGYEQGERPTKIYRSTNEDEIPSLHFVFRGEVAAIKPYGAFVKIPSCKKQGLVHVSQISKSRVEDPSEILSNGEKVFCKVISIEGNGEKIGLSMKLVNQTTGKDEDPNNIELSLDERKKKKNFIREIPKIELGAVLNTTCKKCGGHGHLAQDCFHVKGGKVYELLPEDPKPIFGKSDDSLPKQKKKKTDKKDKSKKKRQHSGSADDDDESSKKVKSKTKSNKAGSSHIKKRHRKKSSLNIGAVCRQLEGHHYKKALKSLYINSLGARRAFRDILKINIRKEIKKMSNDLFLTCDLNTENFNNFNWKEALEEMEEDAPLFYAAIIGSVTTKDNEKSLKSLRRSQQMSLKPGIGLIMSLILHLVNPQKFKFMQQINTIEMWRCDAGWQLFTNFNKLGLCFGWKSIKNLVPELKDTDDHELLTMKLMEKLLSEEKQDNGQSTDVSDSAPEEEEVSESSNDEEAVEAESLTDTASETDCQVTSSLKGPFSPSAFSTSVESPTSLSQSPIKPKSSESVLELTKSSDSLPKVSKSSESLLTEVLSKPSKSSKPSKRDSKKIAPLTITTKVTTAACTTTTTSHKDSISSSIVHPSRTVLSLKSSQSATKHQSSTAVASTTTTPGYTDSISSNIAHPSVLLLKSPQQTTKHQQSSTTAVCTTTVPSYTDNISSNIAHPSGSVLLLKSSQAPTKNRQPSTTAACPTTTPSYTDSISSSIAHPSGSVLLIKSFHAATKQELPPVTLPMMPTTQGDTKVPSTKILTLATDSHLQKAVELVNKATEKEKNQSYEEALTLYESGVNYFQDSMKHETHNKKTKESIWANYVIYRNRVEKLKQHLNLVKREKTPVIDYENT